MQHSFLSIVNMVQHNVTEKSWRKFFVVLTGKTNRAHEALVEKVKHHGHQEANSIDDCDYLLVFCPAVSRVQSDIEDGLSRIPAGKPVILVVMHHTFNPHHIVAGSRRLVADPNVRLIVDVLFYEHDLLNCNCNDKSWTVIQEFLDFPVNQYSFGQIITLSKQIMTWVWRHRWLSSGVLLVIFVSWYNRSIFL